MKTLASDDLPEREPGYEVINQKINEDTPARKRELYHVKLGNPLVGRLDGKNEYVEVEYVLIGSAKLVKDGFTYEETIILASNPEGTEEPCILYKSNRALSLQEALFTIGEI